MGEKLSWGNCPDTDLTVNQHDHAIILTRAFLTGAILTYDIKFGDNLTENQSMIPLKENMVRL